MVDCSSEILRFYKGHVRLSKAQVDKLAGYRETNKDRVENGLKNAENPLPVRHINQGSYAMRTINQHPENDYDIDVGVVFKKEDLKGPQGADKTALDARKMVCDAVQEKRFKKQPEIRQNCVRVYYDKGHHVDMPIYREFEDKNGETVIELASTDWKASDPEAVTKWFNQAVIDKSPDKTNGRQMRRITRLLKFWCKSRGSWNMPSGFIISKLLADGCYAPARDRDDQSLYDTMVRLKSKLAVSLDVYHPIIKDEKISEGKEAAMQEFKDRLETAIGDLAVLLDEDCTRQTALKVWKKFFNHSYFEEAVKNESAAAAAPVYIARQEPKQAVRREGEARFG